MTDRPIIFSAPMVRALLDGRKMQTRRILKDVPDMPPARSHQANQVKHEAPYLDAYCSERRTAANPRGMSTDWCWWQIDNRQCLPTFRVRYVPGDRLYVRESFTDATERFDAPLYRDWPSAVVYRADAPDLYVGCGGWSPSIHMPRRLSRLTLIVEGVRVERLQEISEADARAEGMIFTDFGVYQPQGEVSIDGGRSFHALKPRQHPGWHSGQATDPADCLHSARSAFGNLWNTLHGPDAWAANPWVAAISFRVVKANIDAIANSPICEEVS